MPKSSRIFLKNRALGYVSNHVPCVMRYSKLREEYLISTCVGKAFHTYGSKHLTLLTVSDTVSDEILCMATDSVSFYTSSGSVINAWKANSIVKHTYYGHSHNVHLILPFGKHLVSIDEANNLKVWEKKTQENILSLQFGIDTFKITAIVHPSSYLNKFLLGSEQGTMQLWNLKTSTLIYTFNGWNSCITVLTQLPALDVIAVGLKDGRIILHDIKFDETIVDFKQDYGPVSCISYRTVEPPILVTGSTSGHITFWDLEERKVAGQILEAHAGIVSSIICFPNEPLMITSSPDNSLKMWIFDQPDLAGRLLRLREGHSSQPNFIRFYDSDHILSAGNDSTLRVFNNKTETLNYSLGRASYDSTVMKKKKWTSEYLLMPSIATFSICITREKEWDNIAAVHKGIPTVTSWSYNKRKLGSHKFLPERLEHTTKVTCTETANCVHITSCGNFVIIGYSSGHVERFNIQSGIQRCSYGAETAHKGAIRGVTSDVLNQKVISGCNAGILKIWPFKQKIGERQCKKPLAFLNADDSISFFRHGNSSLLAIILEDYTINLLDMASDKIVRRLSGHTGQITDASFSPNARWLVTSSMDKTIRVWDIPSACIVDMFKVDSPCISLTFSPDGNNLATLHVHNVGIYLWTNKTQFSQVSLKPMKQTSEVPLLQLPGTGVEKTIQLDDEESESETEDDTSSSINQIDGLITMSDLATSRWKNLLSIETIKMRNKPKNPVKAPQSAPFFLPTLPGKDIVFDFSSVNAGDNLGNINLNQVQNYTEFGNLLSEINTNFKPAIDKLKTMSPSGLELEINAFGLEASGSIDLLSKFMELIEFMLSTNRDFELAQAYLGLFIKVHGRTLMKEQLLYSQLERLQTFQKKSWDRLEKDIMFVLNTINILKG